MSTQSASNIAYANPSAQAALYAAAAAAWDAEPYNADAIATMMILAGHGRTRALRSWAEEFLFARFGLVMLEDAEVADDGDGTSKPDVILVPTLEIANDR